VVLVKTFGRCWTVLPPSVAGEYGSWFSGSRGGVFGIAVVGCGSVGFGLTSLCVRARTSARRCLLWRCWARSVRPGNPLLHVGGCLQFKHRRTCLDVYAIHTCARTTLNKARASAENYICKK
jgi:hypothetical protein